ncbi:MAG: EAL domain-containing protein [Alphaproteobacteria bacterium]
MSFLFHTIVFLSYASAAVAVALVAPETVPGIDPNLSFVLGAVVLVGCGLLHEVFAHLERRHEMIEQVAGLRHAQGEVMRVLAVTRDETRRLCEAFDAAGNGDEPNPNPGVGETQAELKVLEKLVGELSRRTKETRPAREPREPALRDQAAEVDPPPKVASGLRERASRDQAAEVVPSPKVASGLGNAAILDIVRDGLNNGRVDLFLQPIVSLPQRKHQFYECFSRIRVDRDTVLVPEQYLEIAEKEGLIAAIDNMLLFHCVQLVRKTQRRWPNIGFFINISRHSLADKPFLIDFADFMAVNMDLAGNLVFEFAQSALTLVDEKAVEELERLASLGFRFSMDHVTNFDLPFEDLARRRVKFVKVDAKVLLSQVRKLTPIPQVIEVKETLFRHGIDLIVEKIESEDALVELLDLPIDFGQGYLFGEPRLSRDKR